MADRDFKGVWIPKAIWLDDRLTAIDKIILAEIDSLDCGEDGCFASNEHIAKFCQCSERKVTESISKLTRLGYVEVKSFDGRKRFLQSCLAKTAGQSRKICEADTQNFPHSNTYSNPFSSKEDEEDNAHTREDNPFGEVTDSSPRVDTVQTYALNNLMTLGYRAMEELNSYVDDLSDAIVRHAIDNALDNGVRNWSYVRAILNQYVERGVRNVADAKAVDESRKKGSAMKGASAQADTDEDHRPRAVVPERQDVDFIFDEGRVHLVKYRILRTGEEVPYSMIQAMCPGEIERFWDSKHVRWHN